MMASFQSQVQNFWAKTSKSQRIITISLLIAAAVVVPVLINWANTPTYSTAFSGLSEADAGQIVQKLDEQGVEYQLKSSGTIQVQSDKVYDVRLSMAREGLPQTSTVGYELFSQNTLGMTEFTQRVNFQRALEGELERTIGSLESIQAVRVHVVTPEKSLLSTEQDPTTASVTLTLRPGETIDTGQVRAITHLVASSVEGLQPDSVVVVDSQGVMLSSGSDDDMTAAAAQSDNQRAAEAQAAADVRKRVQAMLDKTLGPNRSIVQASVAMDWTAREVTSNSYEPTQVAVRSKQTVNETYNTEGASVAGVPGAGSNLPTPVPAATGTPAPGTIYSRSEETVNYEISQVQSKEVIAPGRIDRISVSVMVDNITDANQIKSIKSAVSAAAGIDEERGDSIVVESMAFDHSFAEEAATAMEEASQTELYMRIGIMAGAALFLIILFIIFLRSMSNLRRASRDAWQPILRPVGEMTGLNAPAMAGAMAAGSMPAAALSGSHHSGSLPAGNPGMMAQIEAGLSNAMAGQSASENHNMENDVVVEISRARARKTNPEDEQRALVISKLADENPATVAEIIQIWLSEDEKRNG
ncbi:MAG: flagellar M-ring protein FliF [Anaerolineae bacterium]|nr:flagellar M-ring protein FliF [Anaerolineae bacterium]